MWIFRLERGFHRSHAVAVSTLENTPEEPLPWKEIIAHAAHDMRTPLSCMSTTLEVLRMLNSSSEQDTRMIEILEKHVVAPLPEHWKRICVKMVDRIGQH